MCSELPGSITFDDKVMCEPNRWHIVQLHSGLSELITISGVYLYRLLLSDFILLFCQDGLTALILAVQKGDTETVDVLVKAGVDVNLQENVSEAVY